MGAYTTPKDLFSLNSRESVLKDIRRLEVPYSHTWERENVEVRIRLCTLALTGSSLSSTNVSSAHHTTILRPSDEDKKCLIVLEPYNTSYECSQHWTELGRTIDGPDLLSCSQISIFLDEESEPVGDGFSHQCWIALARAYHDRYEHTDDLRDLEIQLASATYALTCPGALRNGALHYIGSALLSRHRRFPSRTANDVRAAVTILQNARQSPDLISDLPALLFYLGFALQKRFEVDGDEDDLNASVNTLREGLQLTTEEHPWRCRLAHILSSGYHLLDWIHGQEGAAEEHHKLMEEAFRLCPPENIYRPNALLGMGHLKFALFELTGSIESLDQSIDLLREAVNTYLSPTHSFRPRFLGMLCLALNDRFAKRGMRADLDDSIDIGRQALERDPFSAGVLTNLGILFRARFREDGNVEDFEECVQMWRRSLDICQSGHPLRDSTAMNLGNLLVHRSEQTSFDYDDLAEGITLLREAASLRPRGHPQAIRTQRNLAYALKTRFKYSLNPDDLTEAMSIDKTWQDERTDDGMTLSARSNWHWQQVNRAELYTLRFQLLGEVKDLDVAIEVLEKAFELQGSERYDAEKHEDLMKLATSYMLRAELLHTSSDAQRSLELQMEALEYAPAGQRVRALILLGLSRIYLIPSLLKQNAETALELYCNAITDPHCTAQTRLIEGCKVLQILKQRALSGKLCEVAKVQLLEAYRLTLHLLPQVAYFGLGAQARFDILSHAPHLAADAAAHALHLSKLESAIELLEEGRAVFWSQYLRLRSSFDQLPEGLAQELVAASRALESDTVLASTPSRTDNAALTVYEEKLTRRHRVSERFEALVAKARSLPGFESFMLNGTFATLSMTAATTPVVVLIATSDFCGAILLCNSTPNPIQVAFSRQVNVERLAQLNRLLSSTRLAARYALGSRGMKQSVTKQKHPRDVLAEVWRQIMQIIIKALGCKKSTGRHRPRVILCATGQFARVPLHAAGSLSEGCWDYIVPSYTPTLGALITARNRFAPVRRSAARTLLAAVPLPFKWTCLMQTITEIECLKRILPSNLVTSIPLRPSVAVGAMGSASCADVVNSLPNATLLHLACHGYYSPTNPLDSGFVMGDKMLTVAELMALNLPNAFLAFLSACETARTTDSQPDQAVHLAATMLFTGFKSVVGTMWSMGDVDGPVVAQRVYEELFGGDQEFLDPDSVPYALDAAVGELRRRNLHPSRWAPYVHFGI